MLIIIFAQGSIAKANYRLGGTTVIFSEIDFIPMLHIAFILLKEEEFFNDVVCRMLCINIRLWPCSRCKSALCNINKHHLQLKVIAFSDTQLTFSDRINETIFI